METAHSGFVQSWCTLERPICDDEPSAQILQPAVDLTSNVLNEEFSTIESQTGENAVNGDVDVANSDVQSLNLSTTDETILWAGLSLLMKHATAG